MTAEAQIVAAQRPLWTTQRQPLTDAGERRFAAGFFGISLGDRPWIGRFSSSNTYVLASQTSTDGGRSRREITGLRLDRIVPDRSSEGMGQKDVKPLNPNRTPLLRPSRTSGLRSSRSGPLVCCAEFPLDRRPLRARLQLWLLRSNVSITVDAWDTAPGRVGGRHERDLEVAI